MSLDPPPARRRPRIVFLDFGGTLALERSSRQAIYAEVAAALGSPVSPGRMAELMARAHAELPIVIEGAWRYSERWFAAFIERIFGADLGLGPEPVREAVEALLARFADPRTFRLRPGAGELVERLVAAGVRVGVVSNWSPALGGLLEGLGLLRHLDPVVCSALERVEKPDPAIFLLALRRAGLPAAQALHAGDHPDKDVAAARSAGLESVLVDHDGGGAAGEAVGSLPELAELVLARDP